MPIVNEHECRMLWQRRHLPEQSEHVVAKRQRHRDAGEDVNAVGDRRGRSDPGRRSKGANCTSVQLDPRMPCTSNRANGRIIVQDDRPLQRQ